MSQNYWMGYELTLIEHCQWCFYIKKSVNNFKKPLKPLNVLHQLSMVQSICCASLVCSSRSAKAFSFAWRSVEESLFHEMLVWLSDYLTFIFLYIILSWDQAEQLITIRTYVNLCGRVFFRRNYLFNCTLWTKERLIIIIIYLFAVKLPELLACVNIEEETLIAMQQKFIDFLKYKLNSLFKWIYYSQFP